MGLFQRLNALVLAKLRQRAGEVQVVGAKALGTRLSISLTDGSTREIDLARVTRAVAVVSDVYVGTQVVMVLETGDGGVTQIAESCPGWDEVCRALDAVPGSTPAVQWYPQLLAGGGGRHVEIVRAQGAAAV